MPELPEVEVTARALAQRLDGCTVEAVRIHDFRLRWPVPRRLAAQLAGRRIEHIGRRGKYLLWHMGEGVLLSHLGMSGSWRIHEAAALPPRQRHDHVELVCDGAVARFNDPRRFGALLWHAREHGDVLAHPLLAGLGIEPFDRSFGGDWLWQATRGRRTSIKQVLLAGTTVVGVGNIYATESLHRARIDPRAEAGGSTLRDFSSVQGVAGRYTDFALAYDRAGLPCARCGTPIRRLVQGQRATYYCPRCQRR